MRVRDRLTVGFLSIILAVVIVFDIAIFKETQKMEAVRMQQNSTEFAVAEQARAANISDTLSVEDEMSQEKVVFPSVTSVYPQDGAEGIKLDIEDPIVVLFDASAQDFFVDFRLSPAVSVLYENNVEKTEFRILPKNALQAGTQYRLEIFIKQKDADDATYRFLTSTRFTVAQEKPHLTTKEQDALDALALAKSQTSAQIGEGKYIDISLKNQVMILFENGMLVDAYRISSGKKGMDTPQGQFKIENKALRPWSKTYSLYMPFWMAITPNGKFGIHELPEWPSGYKEGANHLGTPVSHGCVRLGVGAAQRVWDWTEVGTPVIVY